jgi:S-adenosylmethionine:tRNA ribosyltransferase-isomerase
MQIEQFNFDLPNELIAQHPQAIRSQSRLLVANALSHNEYIDAHFCNIADYLCENDLLVFNDTKVLQARLYGTKESGGRIELLVERVLSETQALAQIKASNALKPNQIVHFGAYTAKVIQRVEPFYTLEFSHAILDILEQCGHLPLPPYIKRADTQEDKTRYQSIFAKNLGAVAAPTASLHFDDIVFNALKAKNIQYAYLTLHVGAGTFTPVKVENIYEHKMHSEPYYLNTTLIESIIRTKKNKGRIIAVGTTALRALESAFPHDYMQQAASIPHFGDTDIFITPGYQFKVIDGLITNFHLPKSTLLMLVSALVGLDEMHQIYQHAIKNAYRFFSYGDAMLCWRKNEHF